MKPNQKEIAKTFSYLNRHRIKVFIGRVECKYKHIELELSLDKKENCFGEYEEITATVKRTHFNGKRLSVEIDATDLVGSLRGFSIPKEDLPRLQVFY